MTPEHAIFDPGVSTWRDVPGYDGRYEISDRGIVRSWDTHRRKCCLLRLRLNDRGYLRVDLSRNGRTRTVSVASLVAAAFIGPRPNRLTIDHIDSNRQNNRADNLRYLSNRENGLRGVGAAALNARKMACKHGHPLSGENLFVRRNGKRRGMRDCLTCRRLRDAGRAR